MKIKLLDLIRISHNYLSHAPKCFDVCHVVVSGVTKNDVNAIRKKLYLIQCKFSDFVWLIGFSYHESTGNIKKETVRTNKRGRPRTIIKAPKTNPHAHIVTATLTANNDIDCNKILCDYLSKKRKKSQNIKRHKSSKIMDNNLYIVKYIERQSDTINKSNNLDWDYFTDDRYIRYENYGI